MNPSPRPAQHSAIAGNLLAETEKLVELGRWDEAKATALAAGREAEKSGDFRGLSQAGTHLERFEDFGSAARFLAAAGLLIAPSALPEWDGSSSPNLTLQVVQRIRHIGAVIRLARLLPLAASRVGRCVVVAEPRLVSLLRRSFPQLDVRDQSLEGRRDLAEAGAIASYETIWRHVASDAATLVEQFSPLVADPNLVQEFRRKYFRDGAPVVGICWASTNTEKDLPSLAEWGRFLSSLGATYVSLQYGDVAADVSQLRASSGREVLYDETVDSLTDLDTFCAQVAAMDCVVTISNTGAHVAGSLGVRTVVLLDDNLHLMWPVQSTQTAWYPSARLVRKQGRAWAEVFSEVRRQVC